MRYFCSRFFVSFIVFTGLTSPVLADYYQDIADKMLGNIASANSAKDVFDATKGSQYGQISRDFEFFLFQLFKQNDSNGIDSLFKSYGQNKIYKDEEYRDTLFELISLMKEMGVLDEEMIQLATETIKNSTHNSGSQYDDFAKLPEVIEFYDKKYNDKWIRVYSKEWIYAAAATELLQEKAKRSKNLGSRLNNEKLVEFAEKLYCLLGNYNESKKLCIDTHKQYLAIKSKIEADKSIKDAELQAEREIAAQEAQIEAAKQEQRVLREEEEINEKKRIQMALQQQDVAKVEGSAASGSASEAKPESELAEITLEPVSCESFSFLKRSAPFTHDAFAKITVGLATFAEQHNHASLTPQQQVPAMREAFKMHGWSLPSTLSKLAEGVISPFADGGLRFSMATLLLSPSGDLSPRELSALYCDRELEDLAALKQKMSLYK